MRVNKDVKLAPLTNSTLYEVAQVEYYERILPLRKCKHFVIPRHWKSHHPVEFFPCNSDSDNDNLRIGDDALEDLGLAWHLDPHNIQIAYYVTNIIELSLVLLRVQYGYVVDPRWKTRSQSSGSRSRGSINRGSFSVGDGSVKHDDRDDKAHD